MNNSTHSLVSRWSSNSGTHRFGRLPCFGNIHLKRFPSTRTLDSNFLAEYHGELDALSHDWEKRVFEYWEMYWDRMSSVQGIMGQGEPLEYVNCSSSAQAESLHPSRSLKDYLRGLAAFNKHIQLYYKQQELKRHQTKAIGTKQRIDKKYRSQLGMRIHETTVEDFPTNLEEMTCYWDPWYVTEPEPRPYMRPKIGGSYIVNEYYSSDHKLRLRKVYQKDGEATVTSCLRPDEFDKLDVTTLYIYDPNRQPDEGFSSWTEMDDDDENQETDV
ncbi:uncharacterized protein GGS22DRAFT_186390 [Annulohypoxylon maeteangense]|uniref:uncharacterized protein n=1 Tax=Annulohypoxylon maeteangense TaxID=1927788 RepID=UPI002007F0A6|nr:uncharacterized protein GGS22DRAFT_186390 [Annulohypoxylon maeteangense]KAI0887556.1 hypothetical protein GGS22DRAFT_186390 [Annulohypoxylon maeteangense]